MPDIVDPTELDTRMTVMPWATKMPSNLIDTVGLNKYRIRDVLAIRGKKKVLEEEDEEGTEMHPFPPKRKRGRPPKTSDEAQAPIETKKRKKDNRTVITTTSSTTRTVLGNEHSNANTPHNRAPAGVEEVKSGYAHRRPRSAHNNTISQQPPSITKRSDEVVTPSSKLKPTAAATTRTKHDTRNQGRRRPTIIIPTTKKPIARAHTPQDDGPVQERSEAVQELLSPGKKDRRYVDFEELWKRNSIGSVDSDKDGNGKMGKKKKKKKGKKVKSKEGMSYKGRK